MGATAMKPTLLRYYQRLRSQTPLGIIEVPNPCYKSQEPIMLHSNGESSITAARRVGVCRRLGFHLSANLIDTLSRIPISADGEIKPAPRVLSIDVCMYWNNYVHSQSTKTGIRYGAQRRKRGFPPSLIPGLTQHMAKPFLAPTGTILMMGTQHRLHRAPH